MQIPAAIFYVRTQSNTPHHPATAALTLKRFGENGLIKKVSGTSGTLVNYSYLADGTKISALDDQGNGLEYRGSLTFRRNGSSLQIEGIDFPGGRFVRKRNQWCKSNKSQQTKI